MHYVAPPAAHSDYERKRPRDLMIRYNKVKRLVILEMENQSQDRPRAMWAAINALSLNHLKEAVDS